MNNKDLHTIKSSGFKVPENYFEDFDATIFNEVKLESVPQDSGFNIPHDYLTSFKSDILNTKQKLTKVSQFKRKNILLVSSIAAAIALYFSISMFNSSTLSVSDLNTETIDDFIINEIEATELASLFLEIQLNDTQFISDDTLDSYLESEDLNTLFPE